MRAALARSRRRKAVRARERIETSTSVFISAISAFEIGVKYRKGKLILPALPSEWLGVILEHHGIEVIPLDVRIALTATELPEIHNDPCDRIIIASARLLALPVVTTDSIYNQYGVETLS